MKRFGDDSSSPLAGADRRMLARVYGLTAMHLPIVLGTCGAVVASSQTVWRIGWVLYGVVAVCWGLASLWLLHSRGQTVGKALAGLRMVRSDGSRASLGRLLFRRELPIVIANAIPFGALLVGLESLQIFGKTRRCAHDRIADTIVLDLRHTPVDPEEPTGF